VQTYGRIPGFKFLYKTRGENTAVVRLPAEGVSGLFGKKNEWVVRRNDDESVIHCCTEMLGKSPFNLVENGTIAEAEEELRRWQYPELHEAESVWT